jgi:2-isopropylmalate synthase
MRNNENQDFQAFENKVSKHIEIFDTTLRDGEQAVGKRLKHGIESKMEIAHYLNDMGVDIIEAGFPNSSPADYDAVTRIAQEVKGPWICGLARLVEKDITSAYESVKHSDKPMIHVFSIPVNKDALESYDQDIGTIVDDTVKGVKLSKSYIPDGRVQFSAQNVMLAVYESLVKKDESALNFITDLYSKAIEAGATDINLPDTEGYMLPHDTQEVVKYLMENIKGIEKVSVHVHCHNDLGNATANSVASIKAGANCVEGTFNGIGERAGNTALEEAIMNIDVHKEMDCETGVDTTKIGGISSLVVYHTGMQVQKNKSIVGSHAFQHSSGIHQNGNKKGKKKGKKVYQIMDPASVGWTGEETQLTSRSGKDGVKIRLDRLGFDYTIEEVEHDIMPLFIERGDSHEEIDDIDLRVIVNQAYSGRDAIEYMDHSIIKVIGSKHYESQARLNVYGADVVSEAWKSTRSSDDAVGAIDAIFNAIDSQIPLDDIPRLVIYKPENVGEKHSSQAEVTIILSSNGFDGTYHVDSPIYIGRATGSDTLEASAKAYVNALNDYVNRKG